MYARVYRALRRHRGEREHVGARRSGPEHPRSGRAADLRPICKDNPTAHANLPFDKRRLAAATTIRACAPTSRVLDAQNPPVVDSAIGKIYYGDTPLVQGLRIIPLLPGGHRRAFCCSPASTSFARAATRRASGCGPAWRASRRTSSGRRSRVSRAGSSCSRNARDDRSAHAAVDAHARRSRAARPRRASLRAHRTRAEVRAGRRRRDRRAGRAVFPGARADARATRSIDRAVDRAEAAVGAAAIRCCSSGRSRCCRRTPSTRSPVAADACAVAADRVPEGGVRIRVADDGPGVPRELRARIFEPGFSTKKSGWGIGLSLAQAHRRGESRRQLALVPDRTRGATFEIILHVMSDVARRRADRRTQSGAARSRAARRRTAARPRRRRLRQDARAHDAHRAPDRRRRRRSAPDSRRHVHQQGRRRDARAHRPPARQRAGRDVGGTFHAIGARMLRVGRAPRRRARRRSRSTIRTTRSASSSALMERHRHLAEAVHAARDSVGDLRREERARDARRVRAARDGSVRARRSRRSTARSARRCRLANAVDFDDLLVLPVRMLQQHPEKLATVSRALSLHPRRRVSGHEPRAVRAHQAARRRARQRLRRRRRRSVDLRLARRRHPEHPRLQQGFSERRRRAARGELPLDAADPRPRERR